MKNEVSLSEMKGPLGELIAQCSSAENGRERFEEFKLWLKRVVGLLKPITTVYVSAVKRFDASEVLGSVGVNKDGVKIAYLGENFKTQFSNLVECDVKAAVLAVSRLECLASALEIASAIPEDKRAVKLAHVYQKVRVQADGKNGPLLTNGWANLFPAYGKDGNLWLVSVYCSGVGWYFDAYPLDCPDGWCGGDHVLSQV